MIVVIFRSRLREDAPEGFEKLRQRMMNLAQSLPGFISYKVYANDDGERVSIHESMSGNRQRIYGSGVSIPNMS